MTNMIWDLRQNGTLFERELLRNKLLFQTRIQFAYCTTQLNDYFTMIVIQKVGGSFCLIILIIFKELRQVLEQQ